MIFLFFAVLFAALKQKSTMEFLVLLGVLEVIGELLFLASKFR